MNIKWCLIYISLFLSFTSVFAQSHLTPIDQWLVTRSEHKSNLTFRNTPFTFRPDTISLLLNALDSSPEPLVEYSTSTIAYKNDLIHTVTIFRNAAVLPSIHEYVYDSEQKLSQIKFGEIVSEEEIKDLGYLDIRYDATGRIIYIAQFDQNMNLLNGDSLVVEYVNDQIQSYTLWNYNPNDLWKKYRTYTDVTYFQGKINGYTFGEYDENPVIYSDVEIYNEDEQYLFKRLSSSYFSDSASFANRNFLNGEIFMDKVLAFQTSDLLRETIKNGNVLKTTTYKKNNGNHSAILINISTFDDQGFLLSDSIFNVVKNEGSKTLFSYNTYGYLSQSIETNPFSSSIITDRYEVDLNNRLTLFADQWQFDDFFSVIEYRFGYKSKVVSNLTKVPILKVYPNPSNGIIYLPKPYQNDIIRVVAYNIYGQPFYLPLQSNGYDTSDLIPGAYQLLIKTQNQAFRSTLIKSN